MSSDKGISEQDVFNFVFFSHLLTKEKMQMILNESSLNETVDFYQMLKNELEKEPEENVKKILAKKIEAYKPSSNIIMLYPVEEDNNQKNIDRVMLAAAVPESKPVIKSKTFYDNDKTYIIKVINYEKSSKIFVFSTKYELMKDFRITISPQNLSYNVKDNSSPLELDMNVDPESISLEFELKKSE